MHSDGTTRTKVASMNFFEQIEKFGKLPGAPVPYEREPSDAYIRMAWATQPWSIRLIETELLKNFVVKHNLKRGLI